MARGWEEMTSLGQGSDEATEVAVPVLAEAPAATGQSWVVTQSSADGTTTSQPRRSGRDKPGDRAGESLSGSAPSVPGLAEIGASPQSLLCLLLWGWPCRSLLLACVSSAWMSPAITSRAICR